MIAALLAAAALQAVVAPAPPAPVAVAAAVSRPDAPAPDPDAPSAEGLESLRRAYHDSCELRIYGEYDDMCSGLSDQIRHYRADLAKAGRKPRSR